VDANTAVELIGRIGAVPALLQVVSSLTGLRFAAVARVTSDSWTACAVHDGLNFGLTAGSELDVATTLCSVVRDSGRTVVINHASTDPLFCEHQTPKMYGFESYISVPIFRAGGEYFGTICALDPLPAMVNDPKILATLALFAELISSQLEAQEREQKAQNALLDARETAELREQFIAVLGHDIRNPLSSIRMGVETLMRRSQNERDAGILGRIHSSSQRIAGLIDDVLDLARGRLGGGIPVAIEPAPALAQVLGHVVAEVQSAHPEQQIRWSTGPLEPVHCDTARVSQVLSNLLANAVQHSEPGQPVTASASMRGGVFELRVENYGPPIPEDVFPRLFQPYYRGPEGSPRSGLGLGLYIVAEVARSHHGDVDVTSSRENGTVFRVRFPSVPGSPASR